LRSVEHLVNHRADLNAVDRNNNTPISFAAKNNHFLIVEYLVNHGVGANTPGFDDFISFIIRFHFIILRLMEIYKCQCF